VYNITVTLRSVSFRSVTVRSTLADGELISGDYCHAEAFRASCNSDDDQETDISDTTVTGDLSASGSTIGRNMQGQGLRVIVVESALYGRMELGRCVEVDVMGHLGCHTDVLSLVDRRCSGRRRCEIRVPDAELESTRPCLRELKTYLHVSYRCVSGLLLLIMQFNRQPLPTECSAAGMAYTQCTVRYQVYVLNEH